MSNTDTDTATVDDPTKDMPSRVVVYDEDADYQGVYDGTTGKLITEGLPEDVVGEFDAIDRLCKLGMIDGSDLRWFDYYPDEQYENLPDLLLNINSDYVSRRFFTVPETDGDDAAE